MPRTFFKVSVNDVRASNLPKDSTPYVKFNFGGDFKKFRTPAVKMGSATQCNFEFSLDFFYNTTFAHRLDKKFLMIKVYDKHTLSSDKLLGTCKIDLFTIATGPQQHQLAIQDGANTCGLLSFELVMAQLLSDMTVSFSDVRMQLIPPQWLSMDNKHRARSKIVLEYFASDHMDNICRSQPANVSQHLEWLEPTKELLLNTDMQTLLGNRSRIIVSVKIGENEYGRAQLDILDSYRLLDDGLSRFCIDVFSTENERINQLTGTVLYKKGPCFAQMLGGPDQSLHTDLGVYFTGTPLPGFPLPTSYRPNSDRPNSDRSDRSQVQPSAPSEKRNSQGNVPSFNRRGSLSAPSIPQPPLSPQHKPLSAPSSNSPLLSQRDLAGRPASPTPMIAPVDEADLPQQIVNSPPQSPASARSPHTQRASINRMGSPQPSPQPSPQKPSAFVFPEAQRPSSSSGVGPTPVSRQISEPQVILDPPITPYPSPPFYRALPRKHIPEDDMEPLPRHYTMQTDGQGRVYFKYAPAQRTTWQDPRFLPPGWQQHIAPNSLVYYTRPKAGLSTWIDPRGLPPHWSIHVMPPPDVVVMFMYTDPTQQQQPMATNIDPRGLPQGWIQLIDHGKIVYKNSAKNTTSPIDPRRVLPVQQLDQLLYEERMRWELDQFARVRAEFIASQEAEEGDRARRELLDQMDSQMESLTQQRLRYLQMKQEELDIKIAMIESQLQPKMDVAMQKKNILLQKQQEELQTWESEFLAEMQRQRQALLARQHQALMKLENDTGLTAIQQEIATTRARLEAEQKVELDVAQKQHLQKEQALVREIDQALDAIDKRRRSSNMT